MMEPEKLLPQNIEAERGVLGSLIIDPDAIAYVADFLYPDDFYRDAHRTIYEVILTQHERRIPADFITLCDELEHRNRLDEVGGASYITSLINQVPTSGNIEYYGRIVERTSILRRLISAAGRIAAVAYEQGGDAEAALNASEQILFAVRRGKGAGGWVSMPELMLAYSQEIESLQEKKQELVGVPTGYSDLDDLTSGLQKTDLIILAGRPGTGKTSLALSIGYHAAMDYGQRVAVFSLEMGRMQLARRLMAMDSAINQQRLRRGWIEDDEWGAITDSLGKLSGMPMWVNDTSGNPIASMRALLRRLVQQVGGIDLVIVDYLQLIDGEDEHRRYSNQEQEVSRISRGLKGMAREFDVPVLALAQLSRKVEERSNKRAMLPDLRNSGSIEQDADCVVFIYRDDYYAEQEGRESVAPGIAEITIAKQRNGPVGEIDLYFNPEYTLFYNLDERLTPEEIAAWESKKKTMRELKRAQ